MEPGLEANSFYNPSNFTYPFGTHVCVVEIDSETGEVELSRYISVDDVGNVINPMIVEGQIHGGVVQGIGQALLEGSVYDDSGQLLSGSFMDYTMPRADDMPNFKTGTNETPCPMNPLGVIVGCAWNATWSPTWIPSARTSAACRACRSPSNLP